MPDYQSLPYAELKALHEEITALLQTRRREALEQLKGQLASLGFTADDLVPKKARKETGTRKYRDPDNSENTWGGKGPKPSWLMEALESGRRLEEFAT